MRRREEEGEIEREHKTRREKRQREKKESIRCEEEGGLERR